MPDAINRSSSPSAPLCSFDEDPALCSDFAPVGSPAASANACLTAESSAEPATNNAVSGLVQKFPPAPAAALTVRPDQLDVQAGLPRLQAHVALGGVRLTASVDALNANAHLGSLNSDGSHGENIGAGASLLGGELNIDYEGWSLTLGVAASLGGASAPVKAGIWTGMVFVSDALRCRSVRSRSVNVMSSDMPRFVLSSLTFADPPGHRRLHSRGFALFTRLGALLLLMSLFPLVRLESIAEASIHVALVLALAGLLWFRPKPVVATNDGLVVGSGKRKRLVPWSRVLDVRELPWIRVSPPWYPKMWQVDLDSDERFDFCGVRQARAIVIQFVNRSEARRSEGG